MLQTCRVTHFNLRTQPTALETSLPGSQALVLLTRRDGRHYQHNGSATLHCRLGRTPDLIRGETRHHHVDGDVGLRLRLYPTCDVSIVPVAIAFFLHSNEDRNCPFRPTFSRKDKRRNADCACAPTQGFACQSYHVSYTFFSACSCALDAVYVRLLGSSQVKSFLLR